jgi:hypothetical protein
MSETKAPSGGLARQPLHFRLLAAYGGIVVVFLTGVQRVLGGIPKQLVELGLAGLLLGAFATHPAVAMMRARVGRVAAVLALAWPAVVLLVDAAHPRTMLLFPLHKWHMFSAPMGHARDPEQLRYFAHYADGSSRRVMPGAGVSDVVASGLDAELRELFASLEKHPGDATLRGRATAALRGVAAMEAAGGERGTITGFDVERCVLPVRAPYGVEVGDFPRLSP